MTHSIPVEHGQIIEIAGWVRIDESIQESIDGLEIVDSLGGPELALTVRQTEGWQPFQIVRGVPESTELRSYLCAHRDWHGAYRWRDGARIGKAGSPSVAATVARRKPGRPKYCGQLGAVVPQAECTIMAAAVSPLLCAARLAAPIIRPCPDPLPISVPMLNKSGGRG